MPCLFMVYMYYNTFIHKSNLNMVINIHETVHIIKYFVNIFININIYNKRTQRALGRSPEEKVKGHSGAIYRGPLMLSTKYW